MVSRPSSVAPIQTRVPRGASMNALSRLLLAAACLALVAGDARAVPETTQALCSNGVDDDTPPNGNVDCDDANCQAIGADPDNDFVGDFCDNCPTTSNPGQQDVDVLFAEDFEDFAAQGWTSAGLNSSWTVSGTPCPLFGFLFPSTGFYARGHGCFRTVVETSRIVSPPVTI